jgi:hypothetical protein
MDKKIPVLNPEILARDMGDEVVLLEPSSGKCYGLNEVGNSFWKAVDGQKDLTEIIDGLAEEYEVDLNELTDDITSLTASLVRQGLITLDKTA